MNDNIVDRPLATSSLLHEMIFIYNRCAKSAFFHRRSALQAHFVLLSSKHSIALVHNYFLDLTNL